MNAAAAVALATGLAERVTGEVWNRGNLDCLREIYADDVVRHVPDSPQPIVGLAANQQYIAQIRVSFPDLQVTLERHISEGAWAALRWLMVGTHAATRRSMRLSGITMVRIVGGKYAEIWDEWDRHSLLRQLGLVASAGP